MSWNLRRFDALIPWAVGAAVFLLSLRSPQACRPGCGTYLHASSASAVVLAGLSGVAAGFGRRVRWPLYLTAAAGWLFFSMWPAAAAASYYTGRQAKGKRPLVYAVTAVAFALLTIFGKRTANGGMVAADLLGFAVALPLMIGLWLRTRREEQTALQDRRAEQARDLERRRIAREMHDLVAHRVSLMVLHAGALELAATDERTAHTAGVIRSTGRAAMNELRQALGVLRDPVTTKPQPSPTAADIPELVDNTRAAGVPVTLDLEPAALAESLPAAVSRTAYRTVQEGLTNVVKHAGRAPTEVTVRPMGGTLCITVHNGPPSERRDHLPGSGLGLIGLRERVELLGGTLNTKRGNAGDFTLSARMPLQEDA